MEKHFPDDDAIDVILATNMISVGMDIDRLGLMVVMGQPQSTSEYIQATSRVGRRYPGLVVTLLNSGRSRDRSHYESFKSYHSALYRQVESTSVTPFSPRARDRALHAVLVTLIRLTIPSMADNSAAGAVGDHREEIEILIDQILERVRAIDPDAVAATDAELHRVLDAWLQRASMVKDLRYSAFRDLDKTLLLDAARAAEAQIGTLPTLWSLRDVDQESNLYLVRN
jgi:superfamily II DNA or RNA helicase